MCTGNPKDNMILKPKQPPLMQPRRKPETQLIRRAVHTRNSTTAADRTRITTVRDDDMRDAEDGLVVPVERDVELFVHLRVECEHRGVWVERGGDDG